MNALLVHAYRDYIAASHPVHDRPTHDLLREVIELKRQQSAWYDDFKQRHPHTIDEAYRSASTQSCNRSMAGSMALVEAGESDRAGPAGLRSISECPRRRVA